MKNVSFILRKKLNRLFGQPIMFSFTAYSLFTGWSPCLGRAVKGLCNLVPSYVSSFMTHSQCLGHTWLLSARALPFAISQPSTAVCLEHPDASSQDLPTLGFLCRGPTSTQALLECFPKSLLDLEFPFPPFPTHKVLVFRTWFYYCFKIV